MSFGPDRIDWYLRGIRRAEQDGLIDYASKNEGLFAVSDDYGHIRHGDGSPLLLKCTNTRPLSFIAGRILDLYRDDPDVRVLELGPGAGVACATMNRLLPEARIDTVSLTPLNPYLRFRLDSVHDRIAEPSLDEKSLLSFYSSPSLPYVQNQYIGNFPSELSVSENTYHFIYENHGPIYYNFPQNGNCKSIELARTCIFAALSLLRLDGTMLIMASDGSYGMEDMFESMAADMGAIVICKRTTVWHSFPCIVAKKESPLAARLRNDEKGLLARSESVLRLESQTLQDVISQICELR